jgi:hypothetical protein
MCSSVAPYRFVVNELAGRFLFYPADIIQYTATNLPPLQ